MSLRWQYVRCGKSSCKTCPHGPYLYEFWRKSDTGKMRSRYIGKEDRRFKEEKEKESAAARYDQRCLIFSRSTASDQLAREILSVHSDYGEDLCRAAYKRLCMVSHPDRGGSDHEMKLINCAWYFLRTLYRWK